MLLQEFDLEIKAKKVVENSVADHLSRIQFTDMQELPINDFLQDDMMLKVTDSNPWYVNIVNFIVAGYVPPGENKRKSIRVNNQVLPYLILIQFHTKHPSGVTLQNFLWKDMSPTHKDGI